MTEIEKLFYKELTELKHRVSAIEKNQINNDTLELIFNAEGGENARSFTKNFEFVSNMDQEINFNISGKIASESLRAQIVVYLDGIKLKSVYTNSGEFSFVCKTSVDKSSHVLTVNVLYYLDFSLENLTVKFVGAVSYAKYDTCLQVLNFDTFSAVCFKVNNEVTLYNYDGENFTKKLRFNAISAGISQIADDFAVAYVDEEKNMRIKVFNRNFELLSEFFADANINKVSGGKCDMGARFYAVKNSRVFLYDFDENFNFVKLRLNYPVKDVTAFPNVLNAVIFTDFSDNVKLIV